jgi:hypothetical protein
MQLRTCVTKDRDGSRRRISRERLLSALKLSCRSSCAWALEENNAGRLNAFPRTAPGAAPNAKVQPRAASTQLSPAPQPGAACRLQRYVRRAAALGGTLLPEYPRSRGLGSTGSRGSPLQWRG